MTNASAVRQDAAPSPAPHHTLLDAPPDVDIVIPVYDEVRVLESSVQALHTYLSRHCDFSFRITIADNASTDGTLELALGLGRALPEVAVLHLDQKGRGLALRTAWGRSDASVVAYTDVDLSTDLSALPDLIEPLLAGRADIAIGSRLAPGARVTRGFKREAISRTYNVLLRLLLGVGFSDAQCGFKAGRSEVVRSLLARVENDRWFFDTELLYLAERSNHSIREIPVRWVEDTDSRVAIVSTIREDLHGIARLRARESRRPATDRRAPTTGSAHIGGRRSASSVRRATKQAGPFPRLGRPST